MVVGVYISRRAIISVLVNRTLTYVVDAYQVLIVHVYRLTHTS